MQEEAWGLIHNLRGPDNKSRQIAGSNEITCVEWEEGFGRKSVTSGPMIVGAS